MLGRMSDKKDKPTLRNSIEENLRRVYQEMMQEEVPDRFKQLLAELKKTQEAPATGPADSDDGGTAK